MFAHEINVPFGTERVWLQMELYGWANADVEASDGRSDPRLSRLSPPGPTPLRGTRGPS